MEKRTNQKKEVIYLKIANLLEKQIFNNVLRVGDKLPSIRVICEKLGVSMSTAQAAYWELERRKLIFSKPKSGYYVNNWNRNRHKLPDTSKPNLETINEQKSDLLINIYDTIADKNIVQFSLGIPSPDYLPIAKLNKSVVRATRELQNSGIEYESIEGNNLLRRHIAQWAINYNLNINENDVITTAGCINAVAYCLMAVTNSGDIVAVESPAYYGILQLCQSLGLKVLELPTNPTTGIEVEALEMVLNNYKIKACILISNMNNPLGYSMPGEKKKAVVELITKHNVPLIEDDIYGELYFESSRPDTCKSYDTEGMVMLCNSFSKTLAPGYRVGWIIPGKFREQIVKLKSINTISVTSLTHQAIADFLDSERYENHLRKLRNILHTNSLVFRETISENFPADIKISQPKGGFFLWLELHKDIDTLKIYHEAIKHNISITPGKMFTLQNQFYNCMRLSFGLNWNERTEKSLILLGKIITKQYNGLKN